MIRLEDIQRATAAHYKLTLEDLTSHRKCRRIAHPRQVAMILCRELTKASYPEIGRRFGSRDHTTALYALKALAKRIANGSTESLDLKAIKDALAHPQPNTLANRVKAELAAARFLEHVAGLEARST